MARIRTIKPEFYSDPDLGRLSLEARYLYVATWCFADDEGRLPGDPRLLKSQAFPYDDKITVAKVRKLIQELAANAKAYPYRVNGVDYLLLNNFKKHQRINRPQSPKYPPPLSADSVNGNGDRTPLPDTSRPDTTATANTSADAVRNHFKAKGFHEDDVELVVERYGLRAQGIGEPVSDVHKWGTAILKQLAKTRQMNGSGPKEMEIDGVLHRYDTDLRQWVEA